MSELELWLKYIKDYKINIKKETIMKKTYYQPSAEIVVIKAPTILAGSPGLQADEINPNSIEARESNFDFDDEE